MPLQPDLPYASREQFLDHWDGVRFITLKLLASFKDQDLAYRATSNTRMVGETFFHIGGHQYFVARGVLLRRWRPEPGEPDADWPGLQAATIGSTAALHDWLSRTQADLRRWMASADAGALADLRPDNPWHEGIRGWLLLHHPYQDELHHRGQLYLMARLLGREPPMVFAEEHPEYWNPRKGK